ESNRRIVLLQRTALPLGDPAFTDSHRATDCDLPVKWRPSLPLVKSAVAGQCKKQRAFSKRCKAARRTRSDDAPMTTTAKTLLAISLTSFIISTTGVLWGFFLPVGAIIFGLFLIFNLLGKESALFDEEQQSRVSAAEKAKARPGIQETHGVPALSAAR